ncbi:MAG: glycoside hydrolase family 3 N-terminal domain-containing protein [Rhodothermales bacterium]
MRKPLQRLLIPSFLLCLFVWNGCTPAAEEASSPPVEPVAEAVRADPSAALWADSLLATLSVDEKIGQLFIVHLLSQDIPTILQGGMPASVAEHHAGGFLVSRILPPGDVFAVVQRLQRRTNIPLFIAADYERGVGRYNNPLTELPSNMALGATRNAALAEEAGRLTALEAKAIGVNLLFAPVVDVNNNPDNPIINTRSYGEDPLLVGQMAAAFVRGAQAEGVATTLKHFPGHGNTAVDSHTRMGAVPGSYAELQTTELAPYRQVLNGPVVPEAVMTAHLWIPALNDEAIPATLSRNVLSVLRDSLGYDGLVVTDDIKMGALRNTYPLTRRIQMALDAGVDVILTPQSMATAARIVKDALAEGTLTEARLDRSVRRVLLAKAHANLHREAIPTRAAFDARMAEPLGESTAHAIADAALTQIGSHAALPLADGTEIALLQLSNYRNSTSIGVAMDTLAAYLNPVADIRLETDTPSDHDAHRLLDAARSADVVVLTLYQRLLSGRGRAGLTDAQTRLARQLTELDVPVVLVAFGNPYVLADVPGADVSFVAYDQTLASVRAVLHALDGSLTPSGQLPITVASR